jgi:outer membrane protein OmpA-like peptidoglycan-associated protein
MTKYFARPLAMATIVLTLGLGLSGCETMSDLDPTGLLSDDSAPLPDTQFPTDSAQQAEADANASTPDLAAIPTRPPVTSAATTADTTQQVAAAGAQAQYSADALRAGTEAAAAPPVAADANAQKQAMATAAAPRAAALDAPPTTNDDVPPTAGPAPATAAAAPTAADQPAAAPPPSAAAPVQVASAAPPPRAAAPQAAPPQATPEASPAPAPVRSAAIAPPPGAEPAVPMTAGSRTAMMNPTDAQLGFKPSSAPPLNASISQWVAPPILAHYRQTASIAGTAGTGTPAVPAVPASGGRRGMGGPSMSGDVIANLDAVPGSPAGMAASMNGGVPPTAIIYFTGDGTGLPASARAQVRDAVAAFQASGGAGSIKVVGHASSRTANMPVERHLEVIFQKSQARANAVAQALIRAGVPASKVQIEAVGDSQPVYYESMPKGEGGNRRAEIFVQG